MEQAEATQAAIDAEAKRLPNPGQYEAAQNDAKRILGLNIFDGCSFDYNKPLTPRFLTGHR